MKIILFLSLLIWVIPGFGKVKIQKPRSQHVTAFAIIVDEMTLEKTGGAVEAYRDALEADGLSTYIVSGNWKNPDEVKTVFKELKANRTDDYEVYLDKKLPKYLHFATRDDKYNRIGQILLIPKAPKIFLETGRKTSAGKHGYDPKVVQEMKSTFFAWGTEFKNNLKIDEFENVHVYPLVAEILGLKIDEKIDGNFKILKPILKQEK